MNAGWYSFPLAWAVRGMLDRLAGGVGLRRGRRDPDRLAVGEAVDFWRVETLERGSLLRLRAEMRLPGSAWLEFSVTDEGSGSHLRPARAVRATWTRRAPLLVGGVAVPRDRVRLDAARDGGRGTDASRCPADSRRRSRRSSILVRCTDSTVHADVVARLTAAGCVAADEEATELLAAARRRATLDAWLAATRAR